MVKWNFSSKKIAADTFEVMKAMKKILLLMLGFATPFLAEAQEGGMVDWKVSARKVSEQVYEFIAKAVIQEGWHVYAQDSGEGSLPTKFTFAANTMVKLEGKVVEYGALRKERNDVMDSEIRYYADSVSFVQRVKINNPSLATPSLPKGAREIILQGTVEFMVCNESMCLPPEEIPFAIKLN